MANQYSESSYNTVMSNQGGTSSALQLRLDATAVLENIELFLRGAKISATQDESGKIKVQTIPIGRPRANSIGIQSILNSVGIIVNNQVVQGNFFIDQNGHSFQYEEYIIRCHTNMAVNIMNNLPNWEISEDDYDIIIDSIMDIVEPFMTRLIDNKERESYDQSIRHVEGRTVRTPDESIKTFNN